MFKKLLSALFVLLFSSICLSSPILFVSISTDKDVYNLNESVEWKIYSYCTSDTDGMAILLLNFNINKEIELNPIELDNNGNLLGSYYNIENGFLQWGDGGTVSSSPELSRIFDLGVWQDTGNIILNKGNDGFSHLFIQGQFSATQLGEYQLFSDIPSSSYWDYNESTGIKRTYTFQNTELSDKTIYVVPEPLIILFLFFGFITISSKHFLIGD